MRKAIVLISAAITAIVLATVVASPADAAYSFTGDVVGIGQAQTQSKPNEDVKASEKIEVKTPAASIGNPASLAEPAQRVVSTADDTAAQQQDAPVVADTAATEASAPAAVADTSTPAADAATTTDDTSNSNAAQTPVDTTGWSYGAVSCYDGDEYGYGVTVAVPVSMAYLRGGYVEIAWEGKSVVAQIVDTGGFAKYGRVLDLNYGVCDALGMDDGAGVWDVYYRFL